MNSDERGNLFHIHDVSDQRDMTPEAGPVQVEGLGVHLFVRFNVLFIDPDEFGPLFHINNVL